MDYWRSLRRLNCNDGGIENIAITIKLSMLQVITYEICADSINILVGDSTKSLHHIDEDRFLPVAPLVIDQQSRQDQFAAGHRQQIQIQQTILASFHCSFYLAD
jgi:hypothetical protein